MTDQQMSFAEYVRRKIIQLCTLVLVVCVVFIIIFALTATNPMYVLELGEMQSVPASFRVVLAGTAVIGVVGLVVLAKNLMDFIAASDEFVELERLATLGKFSAWAAHQIRNPLAVIRAQTQILALKGQGESMGRACQLLVLQTDKVGDILSLMMTLSQPILIHREVVSLQDLLSDAIEPYRLTYPRIDFVLNGCQHNTVLGHPGLLEEAFKNLLTNAVENIDGQGAVTVACCRSHAAICITIIDSGPAISDQAVRAAFEIGFTTKTYGTGLGLPIVKTILTAHGGSIRIDRATHQRTRVHLEIPALDL